PPRRVHARRGGLRRHGGEPARPRRRPRGAGADLPRRRLRAGGAGGLGQRDDRRLHGVDAAPAGADRAGLPLPLAPGVPMAAGVTPPACPAWIAPAVSSAWSLIRP